MTSLLTTINTERRSEGLRVVIAAKEKVGKTTFAASAPHPLLIPLEIGYGGVSVAKTEMVNNFNDVLDTMNEIIGLCQSGQFQYKTLVFDSATALEKFIHAAIVVIDGKKDSTMESALGGYGKAYTFANQKFDAFLKQCDYLAVHFGINIIFTCHVFPSKIIDPIYGEYDSWDLELHSPKNNKTYGKREIITQWADIIGFLYEPIFITSSDNIQKAISKNQGRVLGLSRTPSYTAGNRYRMEGEIQIPMENGWNQLAHAVYNASGINVFKS